MNEFITQIKKNGAVGVLAMWLWYTHTEVQELKQRLYECYGKQVSMDLTIKDNPTFAIKPKDELTERKKRNEA
jgi:hypothetical protein